MKRASAAVERDFVVGVAAIMGGMVIQACAAEPTKLIPLPDALTTKGWTRIRVDVNPAKVLHRVCENQYHGVNFVGLWNDTGDSPGTVKAFAQMGLGLVRFPGGCPAQWYDWEHPLASGWTDLTPERAWGLAKAGGAKMLFQTNVATDKTDQNKNTGKPYAFDSSGEHAAGWVRACKQKGIDVAFWEIGNEPEIDFQGPDKGNQDTVFNWYNAKYKEQVEAMRKADPKARFMGPASCNVWFWWAQGNLARFLKAHGNKGGTGLADAISLHWYPAGGSGSWEQKRGAAQEWGKCMDFIRQTVRDHDTRELPVYITEWNWGAGDKNDGAQWLANALGTADIIGMFLRTGVAGHTFFCLQKIQRNCGVLAVGQDCRPRNETAPTYYALALASRLGGEVLETRCPADEANVLSTYATRRQDSSMQVMLINKGAQPLMAEIAAGSGAFAGKPISVYTLAGAGAARQETGLPTAHGTVDDTDVIYNGRLRPRPWETALPNPRTVRTAADSLAQPVAPFSMAVVEIPGHPVTKRTGVR